MEYHRISQDTLAQLSLHDAMVRSSVARRRHCTPLDVRAAFPEVPEHEFETAQQRLDELESDAARWAWSLREAGDLTETEVRDAHRGLYPEFSDVAVGDLIGLAMDRQR
ncbi:hypothetical protein [Curtobacterium sp. 9128]|uniref:hypothetical protein n=1 Tax=Curtobacterium sp. 9128 TaxID=1793722 RepID=UPI002481BFD9|nr:hypothetical protein [Curtobacterium sp. 9128]